MNAELKDSFRSRADSLFSCLDSLEEKHKAKLGDITVSNDKSLEGNHNAKMGETSDDDKSNRNRRSNSSDIQQFSTTSNKEEYVSRRDDFKSPRPIKRNRSNRKIADHVENPDKWVKYSLKYDGSSKLRKGLSDDQLNSKIAIDFIEDLKQRKESKHTDTNVDTQDNTEDSKIVFKKPKIDCDTKINSEATFQSSSSAKSFVMKTFEFGGQSKKTLKDRKIVKNIGNNSEIMTHLSNNDDDYDDDYDNDEKNNCVDINNSETKLQILDIIESETNTGDTSSSETNSAPTFVSRKKLNRKNLRKKNETE